MLSAHSDKLTDDGRQRLVRHGHLPEREIMTGIGPVAVRCPRVRDRTGEGSERIRFSSAILPPYARRSKSLEVPIPILYLKGVSIPGDRTCTSVRIDLACRAATKRGLHSTNRFSRRLRPEHSARNRHRQCGRRRISQRPWHRFQRNRFHDPRRPDECRMVDTRFGKATRGRLPNCSAILRTPGLPGVARVFLMRASNSGAIRGRPSRFPSLLARARPARTRSWIIARSNSANTPII